jgi:spore coat protein H
MGLVRSAPCLLAGLAALSFAPPAPADLPLPLVVDCGSREEGEGRRRAGWLPDREYSPEARYGFRGGEAKRRWFGEVSGSLEPGLMASWREGEFEYRFDLPSGDYLVAVAVLETEALRPGERRFDVLQGEEPLLSGIDPFAIAGRDYAFWLWARARVAKGAPLVLRFRGRTERPPRAQAIRIARAEAAAGRGAAEEEAPAAPPLSAIGGFGEVGLFWDAGPEAAIPWYRIEREAAEEAGWRAIGPDRLHTGFFIDRPLAPERTYRYRLLAFDLDGRPRIASSPVAATPVPLERAGLPLWRIEIDPESLARMEADPRSDALWPAMAALGPPGTPLFRARIGRRGGSTRALAKGSWKLKFEKGKSPDGRREVCLKAELPDFTLIQEKLSADVFEAAGLPSPRCRYAHLTINGEPQGVYLDVEVPDDDFKRRLGFEPRGLLARSTSFGHPRPQGREEEPRGRRRGKGGDLKDLDRLIDALNATPEGEIASFFERSFHLDRLIDFLALNVIVHRKETEANDLFYYRHPTDGRWDLIPWDQNNGTWGLSGFGREPWMDLGVYPQTFQEVGPRHPYWWVLWSRLLSVPALRARYLERLEELAERSFPPERIEALVSADFKAVAFAAERDFKKWPRGEPLFFREGPERLTAFYRRWWSRIRELVRAERERPPGRIIVNEFLPGPDGWLEVLNRSPEPVDLGAWRLVPLAGGERVVALAVGRLLPAGERALLKLGELGVPDGLPAGQGGFALLPPREEERTGERRGEPYTDAELIYCGPAPLGGSYGREPDGGEAWRWFRKPTPGAVNGNPR